MKLGLDDGISSVDEDDEPPLVLEGRRRSSVESDIDSRSEPAIVPTSEPKPITVCNDFQSLPMRFIDDVGGLATWENTIALGAAAGGTAILRNNVDGRVIRDTDVHGSRWGQVSEVFSHGGDAFTVHIPLLAGMYATSVWQQNEELHDLTLTMFTSYKFSVLSALVLQYATGTHRTESVPFGYLHDSGFPSEPMSASFAFAAVIDEKFGWKGGVPAYLVAGLIGWSEVDQNHHSVSEVAFGAALGYVIGKSIGAIHYRPDSRFKLVPLIDVTSGIQGIGWEMKY